MTTIYPDKKSASSGKLSNDRLKKWRKENPEKLKEQRDRANAKLREKYKNDPEVRKKFRNRQLKRTYGITLEDYNNMLTSQDGKCKICGTDQCSSGKDFAVDHNHETGEVRSLLCKKCNMGLGHFENNPDACKGLIRYLKENKLCE